MIILDTNVLSELMLRAPDERVLMWLDQQPRTSVWIASITVLEFRFGLEIMTAGRRRSALIPERGLLYEGIVDLLPSHQPGTGRTHMGPAVN